MGLTTPNSILGWSVESLVHWSIFQVADLILLSGGRNFGAGCDLTVSSTCSLTVFPQVSGYSHHQPSPQMIGLDADTS